ncbi:hypothetical protein B5M09_013013 [Aphanomyces astaci]|uniref:Uncharacterized protein n=1 Tax=Aphanomyces astaci TaxID=112090 RepID=A0A425D9H0_APHAT|nr:hypothetical protein B5M09_013013 [Aphanomyces astaci]
MEHTIVSAKGKAKNKSTKENAKLKAPPQIIATVQELRNTTADGEQSLPDAGSEAQRELLQRIKLAYPSDSEDETKDDLDVVNQLIQTYISMYCMGWVGLNVFTTPFLTTSATHGGYGVASNTKAFGLGAGVRDYVG